MATPMSVDFIGHFVGIIEMPTETILRNSFYAPWQLCIKSFYSFLLDSGPAPVQRPAEVIGVWYFEAGPASYLLLLTLKLPIIIFTFASGITLYSLARSVGATAARASTAMLLWFANPLVAITTVMWGTFDVVGLFFTLLSMMLLFRKRTVFSSLSLLTGSLVKVIPLVLLPIYLIHLYRTERGGFLRFALTSAALMILGAITAFWFGGERLAAGAQKVFEFYFPYFAGVVLETGLFQLSSTVVALSLLILLAARFWRFQERNLPDLVLAYLLVFFALAFWHPQYLIYLMAFLTLDYAIARRRLEYLTLVLTALGTSIIVFGFYFSSWGHSVLFIPNYNALMQQLSFFILMLPGHPIFEPIGVVLRSIFAAACLYYAVTIFLRNASRASVTGFTGQREATRSPDNSGNQVPPP